MNGPTVTACPGSEVTIAAGRRTLAGFLGVPDEAIGVVAFAHGSGSGRFSPRNQYVARVLQAVGLATLLLDLLGADEADNRRLVFDVQFLAERLCCTTDWLAREPRTDKLPLGLFGASTGAAAALLTAAQHPERVKAVVSRGGRPDLAASRLGAVQAPTLLIVGSEDEQVLDVNCTALAELRCPKRLEVVPGATHLFEEPGTLEVAARLAAAWFLEHLKPQ